MENLFSPLPGDLAGEFFEPLAGTRRTRVERIVSRGHASPEGFWYDQDEHEFVVVLRGAARLRFEGPEEVVAMGPGDHLTIAAHRRHRVDWTTPDEPTVWLAVFFADEPA
ncbi:cupin domain-containing protein [Paludisphaera mucosa]|uniref:Cupin domain-containing protein n=1 Tax=Paludisphaera mucosa TaxID=3030827 RepID=A0ABT6FEK3_9BACT|nr:cupin domain-containing protein [Paludisphaera mucosa]MDG3006009.1 cupin domain-containing protein [Paludisphaera mucosa]